MIIGFTGIELPQGKIKFHDQKLITLVNKDNPKKNISLLLSFQKIKFWIF